MYCYDATKGKPEGDLNPTQQEAFQNMDTLFKAALLSVLDDSFLYTHQSEHYQREEKKNLDV